MARPELIGLPLVIAECKFAFITLINMGGPSPLMARARSFGRGLAGIVELLPALGLGLVLTIRQKQVPKAGDLPIYRYQN